MQRQWVSIGLAILLVIGVVTVALFVRNEKRWLHDFRAAGGEVDPEHLAWLIDSADEVVVLAEPDQKAIVLFQSSQRKDLDDLKHALVVKRPDHWAHCMCDGAPAIVLFADGKRIGQLTNHHGKLLRCSLWTSDADIVDADSYLKWFDDRNIPSPRREYEAAEKRGKESTAAWEKWMAILPPKVRARGLQPVPDFCQALADEYPGKHDRILFLFRWYGSGQELWSGYPSYEGYPEERLLEYPTSELLAAVGKRNLNDPETEGVARFLAGWSLYRTRPKDLELVPTELKVRLLNHTLGRGVEDNIARAKKAFAEK